MLTSNIGLGLLLFIAMFGGIVIGMVISTMMWELGDDDTARKGRLKDNYPTQTD